MLQSLRNSRWTVFLAGAAVQRITIACMGDEMGSHGLYNGITLPAEWPPRYAVSLESESEVMPVPYLANPPEIIPIDVGRQLFVDDFLIESTTLDRAYHLAEYHSGNPVVEPESVYGKGILNW